jgi:hypothetical protein
MRLKLHSAFPYPKSGEGLPVLASLESLNSWTEK